MLGDLDGAEANARQALRIYAELDHPNLYIVYATLAAIARDRGDEAAAAEWQAKREAKEAELERLRRGEREGPSEEEIRQLRDFVLAQAQAVYAARVGGTALAPDAAEALERLAQAGPPYAGIGVFLREVLAGAGSPALGRAAGAGGGGAGGAG
jgi:hypothetical protein